MVKSHRYLVTFHIADTPRKMAFFEALRRIDPHAIQIVDEAAYGVKSNLSEADIFRKLAGCISLEDELIVFGIEPNHCEVHFPNFKYWLDN